MKKRIIVLLLALLLLCGCGAQNLGGSLSDGLARAETNSGVQSATPAPTAQSAQSAAGQEQEPDASRPPKILISSAYDSRYDYELSVPFGYGVAPLYYCGDRLETSSYDEVNDDPAYPALASALRAYDEEASAALKQNVDELESYARDAYENGVYGGAEDYNLVYRSERTAWMKRADSRLVSFMEEGYWSAGGAHPYTGYHGVNFDSQTGQRLTILDLLTDAGEEQFPALLEQALYEQWPYYKDGIIVESVSDTIRHEMNGEMNMELSFVVDYTALTVLISPYELAAYATGPAFVRLPFADYPGVFEEHYTACDAAWVTALRPQSDTSPYDATGPVVIPTADGDKELRVEFTPDDYTTGVMSALRVTLGSESWDAPDFYGYSVEPYLFQRDGQYYLFLQYELPSDWRSLYVLDLNGRIPVLIDKRSEGFGPQMPTDTESFLLTSRSYSMSTYSVSRLYTLSPIGRAEPLEELYTAITSPVLTLKLDLGVTQLLPDGGEKDVTLSAGTQLKVYRTDMAETVELKDDSGSVYRVTYDHGEDYIGRVNGVALEDAFDGTMFAG